MTAGQRCDGFRPRPGRVDRRLTADARRLAGAHIDDIDAGQTSLFDVETLCAVVGQELRSCPLGTILQRVQQIPRVAGAIGDFVDCDQLGIEGAFALARFGDRDLVRGDAHVLAASQPLVDIALVVTGAENEVAAGILQHVGRDLAQQQILVDALFGAFRVPHGVAAAAVQQAVIAPARACSQVTHLDQDHAQAAQSGVPGDAAAGGTAANDDQIGFERSFHEFASPLVISCDQDCNTRCLENDEHRLHSTGQDEQICRLSASSLAGLTSPKHGLMVIDRQDCV